MILKQKWDVRSAKKREAEYMEVIELHVSTLEVFKNSLETEMWQVEQNRGSDP